MSEEEKALLDKALAELANLQDRVCGLEETVSEQSSEIKSLKGIPEWQQ